MRALNGFLTLLAIGALAASAQDTTISLEGKIVAMANPADTTFSLRTTSDASDFLANAAPLFKPARVTQTVVTIAPFGECNALELVAENGDTTVVAVNSELPFAFIQSRHTNTSAQPEPIADMTPFRSPLALSVPATELKVLGTAGLTAPDANPGSYTFLAVANPKTRAGVVAAWLSQDRGSGLVFTRVENNAVILEPRCEYGGALLEPSATLASEWFVVGYFDDARLGLEQYADLVAAYYQIKLPPQPAGYCTWYSDRSGGASNQKDLKILAGFAAGKLAPYGFSFVQIDDMWQGPSRESRPLNTSTFTEEYLGKPIDAKDKWWNGPHSDFTRHAPDGPYGDGGMQVAAANVRAAGMTPGIWLMPFAWNPTCDALKDHQDWFVKQPNGSLYYAFWAGWCLDMSHPDARAFLADNIRRICRNWGFGYLKLDGLWTGTGTSILYVNNGYAKDDYGTSVLHDEHMTPVEAYRNGLKVVREAAGEKTFLLGCNVAQNMRTLGASFGLLDAMRIGPDNGQDWGGIKTGPWHGTNRYFFNGRVWYNDPDPVYVRASVPIEQARLICSWAALSGELTVNSDWLPGLPEDRLDILRRVMPTHHLPARPVDYFEQDMPRIWQVVDAREDYRRDVVGLFNWHDSEAADITVTCESLGLPKDTEFACFDYWANELLPSFKNELTLNVPAKSCRVLAIRAMETHPFVISTSRHVTQGAMDLFDEKWESVLSGVSTVVAGEPYELRIVLPGDVWARQTIGTSPHSVDAVFHGDKDCLRATLTSKKSGSVKWSIDFISRRG
ncbi:MAG: alpha-galactosidase [Candidatus Hydrogenedentes bacterium]|nr:alpha-galactosidase [Candidatus Hydrogenedentota bacterium]